MDTYGQKEIMAGMPVTWLRTNMVGMEEMILRHLVMKWGPGMGSHGDFRHGGRKQI